MKNAIKFALAALVAMACGQSYEEQDDAGIGSTGDESAEFGTLEQAYTSNVLNLTGNTNFVSGIRVGDVSTNHAVQCRRNDPADNGVTCSLPKTKGHVFCVLRVGDFAGAPDSATYNLVRGQVADIAGQLNSLGGGWSISVKGSGQACATPDAGHTSVSFGSVGTSIGSNLMKDYINISQSLFGPALTESPAVTPVFKVAEGSSFTLDATDIYTKGSNSTKDFQLFFKATCKGMLAIVGVGTTQTAGSPEESFCTSDKVGVIGPVSLMKSGQQCRFTRYSTTGSSSIAFVVGSPACFND